MELDTHQTGQQRYAAPKDNQAYGGPKDDRVSPLAEDRKEQAHGSSKQDRSEGQHPHPRKIAPGDASEDPHDRQQGQGHGHQEQDLQEPADELAHHDLEAVDGRGHQHTEGAVVDLIADGRAEHDEGQHLARQELEPSDEHGDLHAHPGHGSRTDRRRATVDVSREPTQGHKERQQAQVNGPDHVVPPPPTRDPEFLVQDGSHQPARGERP